jgi:hypothetical protein
MRGGRGEEVKDTEALAISHFMYQKQANSRQFYKRTLHHAFTLSSLHLFALTLGE